MEAVAVRIFGISAVAFWSAVATISLTVAQFFAFFSLIPHARVAFYIALLSYTFSCLMLIIAMAQNYLNGVLSEVEGFIGLFMLAWGIIFGGSGIATMGIFGRVCGFLERFRGPPLEKYGPQECFLLVARAILLTLALTVAAAIGFAALHQHIYGY